MLFPRIKLPVFFVAFVMLFCVRAHLGAAGFPGTAHLQATDAAGELSWNPPARTPVPNALTVSCWFKISVPSGVNITENMTILVNRRTGDENSPFAYLIQFNASTGNVEFSAHGTGTYTRSLVDRPYLDRWYHVAVVRSGTSYTGYLDGRQVFADTQDVGNVTSSEGVSIGGWNTAKRLYGEVQEVSIYQAAISQELLSYFMFNDQLPASFPELRGYYKLAYSATAADNLKNFASSPPAGTDPLTTQGTGTITFEETDKVGEQSLFDSRKNQGRDSLAPLSGGFSWQHTAITRATAGVPFEFRLGYSSGNAFNSQTLGTFNPFQSSVLGSGWRNTFDVRIVPTQYFAPVAGLDTVGLMLWDGSLEVWDYNYDFDVYQSRHAEYRGEFRIVNTSTCEWITPDRLTYRFYHPYAGSSILRGRLKEIQDTNGNKLTVAWNTTFGRVSKVTDTAGTDWTFNYNAQGLLTSVTGLGWSVTFTYDANNRLATKTITGPAAYTGTPALNTQWQFFYNATSGLLERITDPLGHDEDRIAYDKYGRKTSVQDAVNRTTVFEYNVPANRQLTSTDPAGKKWIETFDRRGRPISNKDPLGNTASTEYDTAGNVTKTTDARGKITQFTYDSRANVLTRTDALGKVWQWQYSHVLTNGTAWNKPTKDIRPATAEAPAGWENRYTYDAATGNLLTHADDVGTLVTYTYTTSGLVQTAKDANNHTASFTYTPEGFLQSKTDPANQTTSYTRSELGWTLTQTNALTQVTSYSYSINGQVTQILDPLNRTIKKDYDPAGNLISERDAKNQQTTYQYDNTNRLIIKTDRAGKLWQQGWNTLGKLASATDPDNKTTTIAYDDAGRLQKETDPLTYFVTHEYDANGNETAVVDKLGQHWEKTYDALNRVITNKDPLGDIRQTAYDEAGRIKTVTTPRGFTQAHAYDGRGRLVKWTDATGFQWLYTYDGVGNILDIEDALHGHYLMTYGSRNERLTEKNQDNKTWSYTYDELLRLKTQTDPNAVTRTPAYDNGSRVTGVTFTTGRSHTITYDDNNNPLIITRTVGGVATGTTLTYDAMDRVLTSTDAFGQAVGYTYDNPGRIKTITYPGNKTLTRDYDALGRLVKLTDWATRVTIFAYDAGGRLTTRGYPNGLTQTLAYDNAGRVSSLQHNQGNTALIALNYAYDANGNPTDIREKGTLGFFNPQPYDEAATFTAAGRLVNRTDAADATHAKDFSYTYDNSGNMVQAASAGKSYSFTYDEDNRVLTVGFAQGAQSTSIQNRYDALGRRIARTLNGAETRYVLDLTGGMERILCDTDANGSILARYVHGGDLCYREDALTSALTCYHSDTQANIVRTTDASGNTVNDYAYSPYGRLLATTGATANPYRFVGSQGVMEELPNLYFMRARYYSAEAGVFLSTDPVKSIGAGWKPEAYGYANGNPLTTFDPSGLFSILGPFLASDADVAGMNDQAKAAFWAAYSDALGQTIELTKDSSEHALMLPINMFFGDTKGAISDGAHLVGNLGNALGYSGAGNTINGLATTYDAYSTVKNLYDVSKNIGQVQRYLGEAIDKGPGFVANALTRDTLYTSTIKEPIKAGIGMVNSVLSKQCCALIKRWWRHFTVQSHKHRQQRGNEFELCSKHHG